MPMATKEKILEDKAFLSDRISTQVRALDLSVIAVVWLFLVGGKDSPILPSAPDRGLLLLAGLLAMLSLIADYAQYGFGYKATSDVLKRGEAAGQIEFKYDDKAFAYKARARFFALKQVFMVGSLAFLAIAVGFALLK